MNVMEIEHLNLWYGKKQALKDINLEIPETGLVALVGPSGCGKSTFLKTLDRMHELDRNTTWTGTIKLEGKDIQELEVCGLRHRVGLVFQKPAPFAKSIYDNVAYGPRIHGIKDKKQLDAIVKEALEQADLWREVKDRLKDSALALSGGQQQRLCIARTLANRPQVLLMDEPTSALDPISTKAVEDLCLQLKKTYPIVMVTHNMHQAKRISDHTAFFLDGNLVECDTTDKMFQNPGDERTRAYLEGRFG